MQHRTSWEALTSAADGATLSRPFDGAPIFEPTRPNAAHLTARLLPLVPASAGLHGRRPSPIVGRAERWAPNVIALIECFRAVARHGSSRTISRGSPTFSIVIPTMSPGFRRIGGVLASACPPQSTEISSAGSRTITRATFDTELRYPREVSPVRRHFGGALAPCSNIEPGRLEATARKQARRSRRWARAHDGGRDLHADHWPIEEQACPRPCRGSAHERADVDRNENAQSPRQVRNPGRRQSNASPNWASASADPDFLGAISASRSDQEAARASRSPVRDDVLRDRNRHHCRVNCFTPRCD